MAGLCVAPVNVLLAAEGKSQWALGVTPEVLKVKCLRRIGQLHPTQIAGWFE